MMTKTSPAAMPASVAETDSFAIPISAVIPCYNGERFLGETLDRILGQTRPVAEVIVVDDGSTDGSAALAESFDRLGGPPVRVLRQANAGESVARNRGVRAASGEWVAFCDADDLWEPDRLERLLGAAGPDDVAVHSDVYRFGVARYVIHADAQPAADRYTPAGVATGNPFVTPSAVVVRRSACPQFPEWTRHAEDLLFFCELVRRGPVAFVPAPLIGYRQHAAAQSNTPGIWRSRHESVLQWLGRTPDLSPDQADRIRTHWLRDGARIGRATLHAGDQEAFRDWQRYLAPHRGAGPEVDAFLREPTRPLAYYRLLGLLYAGRLAAGRIARAVRLRT